MASSANTGARSSYPPLEGNYILRTRAPMRRLVSSRSSVLGFAMWDQEPLVYPSRGPFNPGVPNRQIWAIGMIVVQWGMAEFIREQSIHNLIGDDTKLVAEYARLRNSEQKTNFWKVLVETKDPDFERTQKLDFITRYQRLNDRRDHVVHRLWGAGTEAGTLGAPAEIPSVDASVHRTRDEKKKTKSIDGSANLNWRATFSELRKIANEIAQLNQDILLSWLPADHRSGTFHIWSYLNPQGKLEVTIARAGWV
jgi:hypothetical protein